MSDSRPDSEDSSMLCEECGGPVVLVDTPGGKMPFCGPCDQYARLLGEVVDDDDLSLAREL